VTRFVENSVSLTHRLLNEHEFALVAADAFAELAVPVEAVHTGYGVLKDSASVLPVVVDLKLLAPQDKQKLLEQMLQSEGQTQADGESCTPTTPLLATLLRSDVSAVVLARHLGAIQLTQTSSQKKAWLRVHDGRVMTQIDRILSDAQWLGLMGPVTSWTCFAYGYWLSAPNLLSDKRPATVALRPDAHTMHALERIGVINRTLPLVRCTGWRDVQAWSLTLDSYAKAASDQYGIFKTSELAEYVRLCVQVHPRFDAHPAVQQLIQDHLGTVAEGKAQDDVEPLTDVLTGQVTEFWRQVKADLHGEKIEERV